MKILVNEKTIRRNAKIGQYTTLGSLIILASGMGITFFYPTQVTYSFLALLIGFVSSQVGIYYGNRWGRRPRIDERITAALKGLTKDYTLYHYLTPVSHLLTGPGGIWVIEPYYQRGKIVYEKGKWKQKGGGLLMGYLKMFAQEGLGRPDIEIKADLENLSEYFKKNQVENQTPLEINAIMVFSDDRAELETEGSPIPVMKIDQMKEFIRKTAKQTPLTPEVQKQVEKLLPAEGIE
jgi:hypothetical protein